MNWDEEVDIQARKKSIPKQGRRANKSPDLTDSLLDNALENVGSPPSSASVKKGGWADEPLKSAKKKSTNLIELERFQIKTKELDDDIPIIPCLEDQDDINSQELKAPATILISESTYKELDSELKREISDTSTLSHEKFGGINFSSLTKRLWSDKDVEDNDQPLTFEMLQEEFLTSPIYADSTLTQEIKKL